jgi:HK97 family phage prohead protease/HK97 family phage major capsid protein
MGGIKMEKYDFSGWATRNNLLCSDGRTILKDAFKHNHGSIVPLVWNHQHNDPLNVLGHAKLENRAEGVYAYCTFNDTEAGVNAKQLVQHGDVSALSIYANQLKQNGGNVLHGAIREVSLVLAGANPGAFIDSVIRHGEESVEEAVIFTGENLMIYHSEPENKIKENPEEETNMSDQVVIHAEETIQDVFNTMNEKQKTVVYALIGQALDDAGLQQSDAEGENFMKHNLFENDGAPQEDVLTHAEMELIMADAKRYGSLKDAVIAHGITNIDYLFPDAKTIDGVPSFIQRDMGWVSDIMNKTHHTPFSRIKSIFANITEADARAKGYLKGNLKTEEVFSLLKRTTTPTTIYKKQKLERDDVIDITDFDVVAWLKGEMRMMLDEEIARAVLVGDGRLNSSDDKINETNIRPIWTDDALYTIKQDVSVAADATDDEIAKAFIRATIKSRKEYKGSGNPTMYITEDALTNCLLLEDSMGRVIYDSQDKLATALRVSSIVSVPVMEDLSREVEGVTRSLMGIMVNLADYNIGADKGGAVNMFDDFDIDYNAQKYLIETRCSGALIKPYSAVALEKIIAS